MAKCLNREAAEHKHLAIPHGRLCVLELHILAVLRFSACDNATKSYNITYTCTIIILLTYITCHYGLVDGTCKQNVLQEASTEEHTLKNFLTKVMNSNILLACCQTFFQLIFASEHR